MASRLLVLLLTYDTIETRNGFISNINHISLYLNLKIPPESDVNPKIPSISVTIFVFDLNLPNL